MCKAFSLRFILAREDIDRVKVFKTPRHSEHLAIESGVPGQALIVDSRSVLRGASAREVLVTSFTKRITIEH